MGDDSLEVNSPRRKRISQTSASLIGLGVGLAAGAVAGEVGISDGGVDVVDSLGALWTRALRMTVIPLVIANLVVAVACNPHIARFGRLAMGVFALFAGMLAVAGAFTVVVAPPVVGALAIEPVPVDSWSVDVPDSLRAAADGAQTRPTFGEWLIELVPVNPIAAAADDQLLPLIVFTLAFAFAMTRITPRRRELLGGLFEAVAEAMLTLVHWILWFTPLGVFALAFSFTARSGLGAATVLVQFVVVLSAALVAFTALLYAMAVVGGRVPLGRFAHAVTPAQLVAVSTRSSLASLPALLDGAKERLRLPREICGFALPLAVSTFKVNRTISSPIKLFFLAQLAGIELGVADTLTFVLTVMILSFSTLGIPSGGWTFSTLPAYLALGIPIEGYVLFKAVDTIPDVFKTLVNVTGDMTATTILARVYGPALAGELAAAEPVELDTG